MRYKNSPAYFVRRLVAFKRRVMKHDFGRRVDFVIAGAQKGGTTALDSYMRTHPEICMASRKEVHFFDDDTFFCQESPLYSFYHSHFHPKKQHEVLGESTPIYMYWTPALGRMWNYNPALKVLLVLRNPVERAYSHWNMERDRGNEKLSFREALENEKSRCRAVSPGQHRLYSYVDRGYYSKQIMRIWQYFPKEQVMVIKSEDLKNAPESVLGEVSSFLGVKQFDCSVPMHVHARPYPRELSDEDRAMLVEIYRHEIQQLEELLGWDCHSWLSA